MGKESKNTAPGWRSNGAALLAGIVLWLVTVFVYAGPSAVLALDRLIYDGGVLILHLAAALGIGLLVLRPFLSSKRSILSDPLLVISALGLGLGCLSLLALLLGLVGFLSRVVAIALLGLGLIALVWQLARGHEMLEALKRWGVGRAGIIWIGVLIAPVAGMMTVCAMSPPFLMWKPGDPHPYDVLEYHLQVPREWYEAGHIFPLHHNVFSYLPFNVEMHYLLAMHLKGGPWAGMYLAQFMHAALVALSVLAIALIARRLVKHPAAGVVAGLAAAGAPMLAQLGSTAYIEGGFLFFSVLSIGWALVGLRESEHRIRRFALAGVFAGLACGAKLTALPEVLVFVPGVLLIFFVALPEWRRVSISHRFAALVTFVLFGAIAFSPWLIRTGLWAGNPLFPEVPQLGRGPFTVEQAERWKNSLEPRADQKSVAGRLEAGWTQIVANWQYGYVLFPAALIALGASWRNPTARFAGVMLLLLCLFWLFLTHLQARFFVLAVPLCALLIATAPRIMLPLAVAQVIVGGIALHLNLTNTPTRPWNVVVSLLGEEELMPKAPWTPSVVTQIPEGAPVALVGDAQAFLYQIPMKRLRYRTVFDVDDSHGKSFLDAVAGPPEPEQVLLIDPNELRRFEQTYRPFPAVPRELLAHDEPYLLRR